MITIAPIIWMGGSLLGQWTDSSGASISLLFAIPLKSTAWSPKGAQVNINTIPTPKEASLSSWVSRHDKPVTMMVVLVKGYDQDSDVSVRFKLWNRKITNAGVGMACEDGSTWIAALNLPSGTPGRSDVSVGTAEGRYKPQGRVLYRLNKRGLRAIRTEGTDFGCQIQPSYSPSGSPQIEITTTTPTKLGKSSVKVVAFDARGMEMPPMGWSKKGRDSSTISYYFSGHVADVNAVEFESRPFEWHTFHRAYLRGAED